MNYKEATLETLLKRTKNKLELLGDLKKARKTDALEGKTLFAWYISRDADLWSMVNQPVKAGSSNLAFSNPASSTKGDIIKGLKDLSSVYQVKYQNEKLFQEDFDKAFLEFHLNGLKFIDQYELGEERNELYLLLGLLSDRDQMLRLMKKNPECKPIIGTNVDCITRLMTNPKSNKTVLVKSDIIFKVLSLYPDVLQASPAPLKKSLAKKLLESRNRFRFVEFYNKHDVAKTFFAEALEAIKPEKMAECVIEDSLRGPIFDYLEAMLDSDERANVVIDLFLAVDEEYRAGVVDAIIRREKSTLLDDLKAYFAEEENCRNNNDIVEFFFEQQIHEILPVIVPHYKKDIQTMLDLLDQSYCVPEIILKYFKDEVKNNISAISKIISGGLKKYTIAVKNILACGDEFAELLKVEMEQHVFVAKAVISAYIRTKGGGELKSAFEKLICAFLKGTDLTEHYKTNDFKFLMRELYKNKFTSRDICYSMLLHREVVLDLDSDGLDLSAHVDIMLKAVPGTPNFLKEPIIEVYKSKLIQGVRNLVGDLEGNKEVLEAVLIHYPELGAQLQPEHFLEMLHHPFVSEDFAKSIVSCMASPKKELSRMNSMRSLLSTCLLRVQSADFFEALFQDAELIRQACSSGLVPKVVLVKNSVLRNFLKDKEQYAKLPKLWQNNDLEQIEKEAASASYNPRAKGLGGGGVADASFYGENMDFDQSSNNSSR